MRAESLGRELLFVPAGDEHQGRQTHSAHHPRMAAGVHQESLRLGGPASNCGPGGAGVDELLRPVLPDQECSHPATSQRGPGSMGATEAQTVSVPEASVAAVAAADCAAGPQALCLMAAWRETVRLKEKSRMRRESHVRFCEGGGVRFPSATRPVWERRGGARRNVTFPTRSYSVNGERRSYALLRPIGDGSRPQPISTGWRAMSPARR